MWFHPLTAIKPKPVGARLERRLYDLAKKRCGDKLRFKIGLEKLYGKSGSAQALKYFRRFARSRQGETHPPLMTRSLSARLPVRSSQG
ncbi:replication initiator protein A [Burkholderia contaminans]